MELETRELPARQTPIAALTPAQGADIEPAPVSATPCPSCSGGTGSAPFVYALGKVEARFPNLSVEKEFAQAMGRTDTSGKTNTASFHAVLKQPGHRYLARQLCWVFTTQGLETYLLVPRDPADLDLLVDALRPAPTPGDLDVVIGVRGPVASPDMCNGLTVPIVAFDQIYSFSREALLEAIPRPAKTPAKQFNEAAGEVFDRILQLTDNAGATDEHRALAYLAMRYPGIYAKTLEQFGRDFSLTSVDVQRAPIGSTRNVVDVIFGYTDRKTDFTEKFAVRVDVTEEFPFLVNKLSPYFDR